MSDGGESFGMTDCARARLEKVVVCADQLGLELAGRIDSPIDGRKGNREMLAWFRRRGRAIHNRKLQTKTLCRWAEKV